jgi:hypothetical protein
MECVGGSYKLVTIKLDLIVYAEKTHKVSEIGLHYHARIFTVCKKR